MPEETLKIVSWNINGKVLPKHHLLSELCLRFDVVGLQEHFLSSDSRQLLEFTSSHNLFFHHAKSTRGRPSGGLALMIRKELLGNLVAKSDSFLAVKVSNVVIFVVYFPTNYRNDMSERKFSLTCTSIAKLVSKYEDEGLSCLLFGDFNCELSDPENNRSQILLHACPSLTYVGNDRDFTYIHQSGSVSQLDYFYCSSMIKPTSNTTVLLDYSISDHMPICNSFQIKPLPQTSPTNSPPKWLFSLNWEAANIDSYQSSCDYILSKIRIPFALLCCPNMTVDSEKNHPTKHLLF